MYGLPNRDDIRAFSQGRAPYDGEVLGVVMEDKQTDHKGHKLMNEHLLKLLRERRLHSPSHHSKDHLFALAKERSKLNRPSRQSRRYLKRVVFATLGSAAAAVLIFFLFVQGVNAPVNIRVALHTETPASSSYEDSLRQIDTGLSRIQMRHRRVYSNANYSSGTLYRSVSVQVNPVS